jgi:hypothetical protein
MYRKLEKIMAGKEQVSAGFVIMNPLTGRPMEKTPGGMSLEGVTFTSKDELLKFVEQHWNNPVFMTDGQDLELP